MREVQDINSWIFEGGSYVQRLCFIEEIDIGLYVLRFSKPIAVSEVHISEEV